MKRAFRITNIERHTPDVKVFTLAPVKPETISFRAGMFVSVAFEKDNEKYGPKPYSVSSSPLVTDSIELTLRKKGRFTQACCRMEVGDEVQVLGPHGNFVLSDPVPKNVVLIAAGTGIAPLMSMLRYILDKGVGARVLLLFSCKTQKDVIFKDALRHRNDKHDNLSIVLTLTREPDDSDWQGHRGRIDTEMLKKHVRGRCEAECYICGPTAFIVTVEDALSELDVPAEHIKREVWG